MRCGSEGGASEGVLVRCGSEGVLVRCGSEGVLVRGC